MMNSQLQRILSIYPDDAPIKIRHIMDEGTKPGAYITVDIVKVSRNNEPPKSAVILYAAD